MRAWHGPVALVLLLLSPGADGRVAAQDVPDTRGASRDLSTVRAERQRAEAEASALRAQLDRARRRLRRRVRLLRRLRRAGSLAYASGFDGLLRHQSRVNRLARLVERDAHSFRTIGRRADSLEAETRRLAETERVSAQRLASAQRHEEERYAELRLLSQMMEDPASFVGPGLGRGFGVRLSDPPARGYRLADDRGHLPIPVGGSAQVRDAEREGGGGLELVVASGVSVRAVAPGTVSYADTHPAYGRLVIVDHGDGHYTVYGGLGALAVRSGASVAAESVLGAAGPQPVFFQVRRGTRSLRAREWLGI